MDRCKPCLSLTRAIGEKVFIQKQGAADFIEIELVRVKGSHAVMRFKASQEYVIDREEIYIKKLKNSLHSVHTEL